MKFISEAVASWQVERLESLIANTRVRVKQKKLRSGSLVAEHLNLADENLDEAIAAMKYRKFDQASVACQSGFVQLGLAELLLQYGERLDSGIAKVLTLAGDKQQGSEEEELANYLASSLAEMKVAIEYSNCKVSDRSRTVLDHAMDYYNDALRSIVEDESDKAKAASQAGLLCLHLASELISAENQMALPGWRGLSNPMLAGPLRRANHLVSQLAEVRQRLHQREKMESPGEDEKERSILLRKHWEKSFNDLMLSMQSLAAGSTAHAQALLKGSLREVEQCCDIIGIEDPDELQEEIDSEKAERTPLADALSAIAEVKEMLSSAKLQRKEYLLSCLDKIKSLYKEAVKYYDREQYDRAEKSISDALLDLDLIRQQVYFRKQRLTGSHSTTKKT